MCTHSLPSLLEGCRNPAICHPSYQKSFHGCDKRGKELNNKSQRRQGMDHIHCFRIIPINRKLPPDNRTPFPRLAHTCHTEQELSEIQKDPGFGVLTARTVRVSLGCMEGQKLGALVIEMRELFPMAPGTPSSASQSHRAPWTPLCPLILCTFSFCSSAPHPCTLSPLPSSLSPSFSPLIASQPAITGSRDGDK